MIKKERAARIAAENRIVAIQQQREVERRQEEVERRQAAAERLQLMGIINELIAQQRNR